MNAFWEKQAEDLERRDPLNWLPDQYHHPKDLLYLDGNSLGLMSFRAKDRVLAALDDWANLAVMGWTDANPPWFTWVEEVADTVGSLLGAVPGEITLGASTTVMLHQLLATFYQAQGPRRKILVDGLAFPTDRYAAASFLEGRWGPSPDNLVVVNPRADRLIYADDIVKAADSSVALAVLPSVVFSTGQALPMVDIQEQLRARDILTIWDLSHSAGLLPHQLHHHDVDAAVFCTYKYLGGGPGSPGALFVHQRHWPITPGLAGWWGSSNERQFAMPERFESAVDAHALQLGTPSILALASLAGSTQLLAEAGIEMLYRRSQALVGFLARVIDDQVSGLGATMITPARQGGGHITISHPYGQAVSAALRARGVISDFRAPDMIRLAPVPQTTRFRDCLAAVDVLREILETKAWQPFTTQTGGPVT